MKVRPLFWQVFPAFGTIVLCSMFAAAWYASHEVRTFHYRQTELRLVAAARMAIEHLTTTLDSLDEPDVDRVCDSLGAASGYRITLILPSGKVTGDSKEDPAVMDDHSTRPEIREAFVAGEGCARRFSDTLKMNMMYVAVAVPGDGKPRAVLRTSLSLVDVDGRVNVLQRRIATAGLVLAVVAAGFSFLVSRRISRPIQRMRDGAALFSRGDFSTRLPPCDIAEVNLLGRTMNMMAGQLRSRIDDITRQRDEQHALFACMTESVIAVDTDRRVIKMNAAAEKLFGLDQADCLGRNIVEVIRNSELHDIVERALDGGEPTEGSLHLFDRDMYLQVHGTVLHGPAEDRVGAVLVLSNVTRMRRLETMRRDFVANVSHELKTPITSIVVSAETLREGAAENKADRDRFLEMIHRHAARLSAIVEDLLMLSRIEHGAEQSKIELVEASVGPILASAVNVCRATAEGKEIDIAVDCPDDVTASMDRDLLEQAVTYLVDNAVKYSDRGTHVQVEAGVVEDAIHISVRDEGPGIGQQHVSRLFERFYRVDKGRSREQGGTGLGLAIVKHIANVHRGSVDVVTGPGEGSTFTIRLPRTHGKAMPDVD